MLPQIHCLLRAAARLGMPARCLDPERNLVLVDDHWLFQLNRTPFNTEVMYGVCRDKAHQYWLLEASVPMPRTRAYLDPGVSEPYRHYCMYSTLDEITADIQTHFDYPVVVKRNAGALANNVFLCRSAAAVDTALRTIYRTDTHAYDFVALAQSFIRATAEYRVVCFEGEPVFAYQRFAGEQDFRARYWELAEGRPIPVRDRSLLTRLCQPLRPVFELPGLRFVGLDVALTATDEVVLLELNSSPQFRHYIEHHGEDDVVAMYETVLSKAREPVAAH